MGLTVLKRLCSNIYQTNYSTAYKDIFQRNHLSTMTKLKYLNQEEAIMLDVELFEGYKFSVDQLMELVGLYCAEVVAESYPNKNKKILVFVGPGNNGGDGLVCSRHLKQFGFSPEIIYPKQVDKPLYTNRLTQCLMHDIPVLTELPSIPDISKEYSVIVDALFGFSFKPPVRPLFGPIMNTLYSTDVPIVSIDIPSGWDVETGPKGYLDDCFIRPDTLISCSAPKLCAKYFTGRYHYLAGRFIPPKMQEKYDLNFPEFPGTDQTVLLNK